MSDDTAKDANRTQQPINCSTLTALISNLIFKSLSDNASQCCEKYRLQCY